MYSTITKDKKKVVEAIREYVDVVASTAGRRGHDVILTKPSMLRVIKDGAHITRFFSDKDPIRNIGVKMVRDVAEVQRNFVGDGTTAATVMFAALCEGVAGDVSEFVRGMDDAKDAIIKNLKEMALPIEDGLMKHVSDIAMNGHPLSGEVAGLVLSLGIDGKVAMSKSDLQKTIIKKESGFVLDWGLISPYMQNQPHGLELDSPLVVVSDDEITSYEKHLKPILEKWSTHWNPQTKTGRPLLIFCKDMRDEALRYVLSNINKMPVVAVKVSEPHLLNDLKIAVKADKVYGRELGQHTKVFNGKFGSAKKVEATMTGTVLIMDEDVDFGPMNAEIKVQMDKSTDSAKTEMLKDRLVRNTTGFGHISVGKTTDVEQDNLFEVLDDGQRACLAAFAGVLPGGGNALVLASDMDAPKGSEDYRNGFNLVVQAASFPYRCILANAGIYALFEQGEWTGIDVSTGETVNLLDAGIVDPLRVVVGQLENAVSAAKSFHRSKYIVTLE